MLFGSGVRALLHAANAGAESKSSEVVVRVRLLEPASPKDE